VALKAFKSQLGIDIWSGVLFITREKKCCQGELNDCGEDSHARVLTSVMAEAKCTKSHGGLPWPDAPGGCDKVKSGPFQPDG
jgi:hypothetical protein